MPLRGFLRCPYCGSTLTGSASRGRQQVYHYYHCYKGCRERYRTETVNDRFSAFLKSLRPKRGFSAVFKAVARDVFKQQTQQSEHQRLGALKQVESMQARLKKARELLLNEAISPGDYRQIKTDCEAQFAAANSTLAALPAYPEAITQLLNRHAKQFLNLHALYEQASTEDKRRLFSLIFSEKRVCPDAGFKKDQIAKALQLIY